MANWLETHAPLLFADLATPLSVREALTTSSIDGDPPHLLLSGPAGVGKTAAWRLVARQVLGPGWRATHHVLQARDLVRKSRAMQRFESFLRPEGNDSKDTLTGRLSLDAFDRSMIESGADDPPPAGHEATIEGRAPIARLIVIEDADHLGPIRQPYLRRMMEIEGTASRFVLTSRSPSRIIDALRSRTRSIRLPAVDDATIATRLREITTAEGLDVDDEVIGDVVHVSDGNLRRSIFTLQMLALRGLTSDRGAVHRLVSAATLQSGRQMLELALRGRVIEWRWESERGRKQKRLIGALGEVDRMMLDHALDGRDIMLQLHRILTTGRLPLPDALRTEVLDALARCDARLDKSLRERIQIERFLHEVAAAGARSGLVLG